MTTNARLARIGFAVVLSITVSLATGCKSGGSKWAWWNPLSRSAADTSLIARTAPALPSHAATPLIEGVATPTATVIASTPSKATTTPAMPQATIPPASSIASSTPSQEAAKLTAMPQISAPAAQPYIAPAKGAPAKTMTPAGAYAAAGPYNPNAYQPSATAPTEGSAPSESGRYGGLGDRYASAASNSVSEAVPDFSKPSAPATPVTPDRYGMGGRYASAPVAAAPVSPAPTTPAPVAPAATLATTTPPPVTPVASPATPHPTQSGTPAVASTLPATSVYSTASAVPTTTPTTGQSEIRLTSLPGEYRPGGTGTYKAGVSVATPPATTPRYR